MVAHHVFGERLDVLGSVGFAPSASTALATRLNAAIAALNRTNMV
jgi:hypothetical protein